MMARTAPFTARRPLRAGRRAQAGVATLIVVMSLFFVVSLAAAYASRNLIFEQRTSANQYRATQALEAAEAGVEWVIGLLNGGRVDASCVPTNDPAATTFRTRFLGIHPETGAISGNNWTLPGGGTAPLQPTCVRGAAGWICSCPADAAAVLAAPDTAAPAPAFRISFEAVSQAGATGVVRVLAIGCTSLNEACLGQGRATAGDSVAVVRAVLALAASMPTAPAAPVSARGSVDLGAYAWPVANTDSATNGITINAGGAVNAPSAQLHTVAGTPGGSSVVDNDVSLSSLTAARMFATLLGVTHETFRRQPSTVVFDCGGGCSATLAEKVTANPGRPIWIDDNLVLDADTVIGAPDSPVLLVVGGNVNLATAGAVVHGVVYTRSANAQLAGSGLIQGALIAEGNLNGASAPAVTYDAAAVTRLRVSAGPFMRVPGAWNDFP